MKFHSFLIKYGEIGIKGKNRYIFEDALVRQILLCSAGRRRRIPLYTNVTEESTWIVMEIMILMRQ